MIHDLKIVRLTSPATGRERISLILITDGGERTFMVFRPEEYSIARDYANQIMTGADPEKLRMTCSEDRFLAEPTQRVGRQGRPRKERA